MPPPTWTPPNTELLNRLYPLYRWPTSPDGKAALLAVQLEVAADIGTSVSATTIRLTLRG